MNKSPLGLQMQRIGGIDLIRKRMLAKTDDFTKVITKIQTKHIHYAMHTVK